MSEDGTSAAQPRPTHLVVRNPILASLLAMMLAVLGLSAVASVPLEQAPEVTIGIFLVNVVYPGAGPEDIEREVSRPLEEELRAVRNVEWISTTASDGVSVSMLRMVEGADLELGRRDIKKAIDLVRSKLPDDAEAPVMQEVAFGDIPIIYIAVSGPTDPVELRGLAEDLRDEIETVYGVSEVEVFGGAEREVRVRLDPERMRALQVDMTSVAGALSTQGNNAPAGVVDLGDNLSFLVRTTGAFKGITDIGEVVVPTGSGAPVKLSDIGTVRLEPERRTTDARVDLKPAVTLLVRKETGISTIPAAEAAKAKALEFAEVHGVQVRCFLEQKRYIERMLGVLSTNALGGMVLVIGVLALFLGLRLGLLIALAIPISLGTAVIGLWFMQEPLSGVAVFGLVLVLGMVVDGAIVMGEVTDRLWREGASPPMAADGALHEVGRPIIASALTTMAAFVPMVFMPGVSGQFMGVLPVVVTVALVGAVIADHILVPAAFSFVAAKAPPPASGLGSHGVGAKTLVTYGRFLQFCLRQRIVLILLSGGAIAAAGLAVVTGAIGFEFFPRVDNGIFWVDLKAPAGTTLDVTTRELAPIEAQISQLPGVDAMVATVGDSGRLNVDVSDVGGGIGPEWGRVTVELMEPGDRDKKQFQLMDELRERFPQRVGMDLSMGERREGPPQGAPVAIRIQGARFEDLRRVEQQVMGVLEAHPAARDVRSDLLEGRPELQVEMLRGQAGMVHGLSSAQVARALQLAVFGVEVATYVDGDDALKVRLTVGDGRDLSMNSLGRIPLRTASGAVVPLDEVAKVKVVGGFQRIKRRNFKRTITVRSELASGFTSDVLRDEVKAKLDAEALPPGVSLVYEGDNVERDRSFASLITIYPVALIIIFAILVAQFGSFTQPICVVLMIPLSWIGAILGLAATGLSFGIMAGVGLVALSGIVVNDAIVLVDAINVFRAQGQSTHEAALSAGIRRFRAVWLTTLTTFGGLSPFALALTDGAEFWQPLAVTICFGLLFATVLILVVLPGIYTIIVPTSERAWHTFKRTFKLGEGYGPTPT